MNVKEVKKNEGWEIVFYIKIVLYWLEVRFIKIRVV